MLRIKPILCSCICIFFFTALTAQVSLQKEKTISNVVDEPVYQQKHCNIQQVLKDSVLVLYKYESDLGHSHSAYLKISHLSRIYISYIDCLVPPTSPDSTVSEKLQSHLQTSLLQPYTYHLLLSKSCWNTNFFRWYEVCANTFFNYQ